MKDFILPDIGEGIVECELLEWLVSEGEIIVEDQPVAEVMTDKATVQIPAMYSGKVQKLYYKAGEIAKVHQPLFAMELDEISSNDEPSIIESSVPDTTSEILTGEVIEDFILPDIGEGIVECELVKWLVEEGDSVLEDQVVVEVMTDKAVVEIPAKHTGSIEKLYYQQGEIAQVHSPLFSMKIVGKSGVNKTTSNMLSDTATQSKTDPTRGSGEKPKSGKALASPAVRRLAREKNIDLGLVNGSGKKGRVMKDDLLVHQSSINETVKTQTSSATVAEGGTRVEKIRGIKAAMAKQMTQAVFTIPHFTVSEDIEMDSLIEVRQSLKAGFEAQGVKLSFMPFFIKALSLALKAFPIINSQVNEDCSEITYFEDHNVGMAVDSKIGLLVPNIKGVQNLTLLEIAIEANRIIELAREGKLPASDLKGGTISISNIGVLGGTVATPVINKPESAIVALGKMQRLPRFDDNDQVTAVNIMTVSWSGDHRIIDGATMVRFNNLWKSYLENPMTMLADLK